ncbi:MAG TPA: hypothetical protein DCZ03_07000 [Gammaproteobacteria bacterium]|nr:hypothetical protein [Gammaproteobacteria bacterium]
MTLRRYTPMITRLMGVYEENYKRLEWFLPETNCLTEGQEIVTGDQLTRFTVKEKHRFTTLVEIEHRTDLSVPKLNRIQFLAKLSHDARVAEVVRYQGQGQFREHYARPNPNMYQVNEKELSNFFLYECLKYWMESELEKIALDLNAAVVERSHPTRQEK